MIAIPCYNAELALPRSLKSGLDQTRSADVIVVDNCSTDGSLVVAQKFAQEYPNLQIRVNDSNVGRVGNWNVCLDEFENSGCEFLVLLFTGDELLPECVESLEDQFDKDSKIGAVVWPHEFVRADGKIDIVRRYKSEYVMSEQEALVENLKEGSMLGAIVGNAYSKRAIRNHRFRVESIGKAEFDIETCYGFKLAFLDNVLARFNVSSHNTFEYSLRSQSIPYEVALASAKALERYWDDIDESSRRQIIKSVMTLTMERQTAVNGLALANAIIKKATIIYMKTLIRFVKRHLNVVRDITR